MKSLDNFRNVLLRPYQTLGQLANKYYGDPTRWRDIVEANPEFNFLEDRQNDVVVRVPLNKTINTSNIVTSLEAADLLFNNPNATLD